jgi:hypothetical protein
MNRDQKIDEAIEILESVGMPKEQLNERSALCLLALLNVGPENEWSEAEDGLIEITPIMDWSKEKYGKVYAPNSRETFRQFTMHQFIDGGIALYNPDKPERPVNSPNAVYQVRNEFLELVRTYGTHEWQSFLDGFLAVNTTLVEKNARSRDQIMVPVTISDELTLKLSSGEHSLLIKAIIEEFGPRFAPGSKLLYVGDTGNKFGHYDHEQLAELGVVLDNHGKMPDVVLYNEDKQWLLLIESVTSHGPIDGKRYRELEELFKNATPDMVYVTALPSRSYLARFLPVIAWETEVWVSDSPSHMIHFNGDKFVGPYVKKQLKQNV